jgi:hypothetical protein
MHRSQAEEEHGPLLLLHMSPHTRTWCYMCVPYDAQVASGGGAWAATTTTCVSSYSYLVLFVCVYRTMLRLQVEEELGPLHSADLDVLELEAEELELQVLQASFCRP